MKLLLTAFLFLPFFSYSQNVGDRKIVLITKEKDSFYLKVKYAFAKCNFMVKDDGNKDTLRTFAADLESIPGKAALMAVIKNNTIELVGYYGLKRLDDFGYTQNPKKYKPIIYFKGSKAWMQLSEVANKIGYESLSYEK